MTNVNIQHILLNQLPVPKKLLTSYKSLGLNEQEVMIILQIHRFIQEENDFPTPSEIASYVTLKEEECMNLLRKLIQKKFLTIEELNNEEDKMSEAYSLNPLWERLLIHKDENDKEAEGKLFILFEQEFGRPLSPFEIETVNVWLDEDEMSPELIKAGLRESVLMGKLNFKYIDRILREWKRKGIVSVEQAREAGKAFHQQQTKKQYAPKKRDTSVYYNWLDGGDTSC